MEFQLKFLIAVQILLLAVISQSAAQILIGSVDGKTYYANPEQIGWNWTESKRYCEDHGMNLATVTSLEQSTFLNSKWDIETFNFYHWIDLVDTRLPGAFSWGDTGLQLENLTELGLDWHPLDYDLLYGSFIPSYPPSLPRIVIFHERVPNKVLCQVITN